MDTPRPCIFFNTYGGCTRPYCQFSHLPDPDRSIQLGPGCPNVCKKYLLDPKGCHRFAGTCWYSHDIMSAGHTNFQKLYNLLSEIRKAEFQKTGQHDTGSFVARFMTMLVEESYAKDGVAFVAADGVAAQSVIGDKVLDWLGGVQSTGAQHPPQTAATGKRKRNDDEAGGNDIQDSHRTKMVKIKEEPKEEEETNALRNLPNLKSPRPQSRPVKIKREPGLQEPTMDAPARRALRSNPQKKKKDKSGSKSRADRGRRKRIIRGGEAHGAIDNSGLPNPQIKQDYEEVL